jgi:hypothetical protein
MGASKNAFDECTPGEFKGKNGYVEGRVLSHKMTGTKDSG